MDLCFALMHAILRHKGVSRNGILPLAAGILEDPDIYFGALDAYRTGDLNAIVWLIAHATLRGAELGEWLGSELIELKDSWDYVPYEEYTADDCRRFSNLMSARFAYRQAVSPLLSSYLRFMPS